VPSWPSAARTPLSKRPGVCLVRSSPQCLSSTTCISFTELVLKQVVAHHRFKAGVDDATFAVAHFIDGRSLVVVDAPLCNTAKDGKASGVCINLQRVGLGEVCHQQEFAACCQFDVGHIKAPSQDANDQVLTAPIKLERFAQLKVHGHKACTPGLALRLAPLLGKGLKCFIQIFNSSALKFVSIAVGFEPIAQLILKRIKHTKSRLPLWVSSSTILGSSSHRVAVLREMTS
jgi:hypothetical protein